MDSGERGMNPVAMTIINPRKEYWQSRGSNQRPPVLKFATLTTELWDSARKRMKVCRKVTTMGYRGYLFFSVKDRNLFHRVDTIGNIFTSGAATRENISDGVHEMK